MTCPGGVAGKGAFYGPVLPSIFSPLPYPSSTPTTS